METNKYFFCKFVRQKKKAYIVTYSESKKIDKNNLLILQHQLSYIIHCNIFGNPPITIFFFFVQTIHIGIYDVMIIFRHDSHPKCMNNNKSWLFRVPAGSKRRVA